MFQILFLVNLVQVWALTISPLRKLADIPIEYALLFEEVSHTKKKTGSCTLPQPLTSTHQALLVNRHGVILFHYNWADFISLQLFPWLVIVSLSF